MRLKTKAATLAGALLAMGGGTLALSAPAMAAPGVNMNLACQQQQGSGWEARSGSNVYSWYCIQGFNGFSGVDVSRACRDQNPGTSRAEYSDYNNAYSWYCV